MTISHFLLKYKFIRNLIRFSKRIVLPGFDGIPLFEVARFFIEGIFKGSITSRASSIAFSFFMAVFPMIIVFFTLIPFIPIENFHEILLNFIQNVTPDQTEAVIRQTVEDIIERPRGGLLSLTFFLALFFATNGFDSIIDAFNKTWHTMETRSWVKQKLTSALLFFIASIIVIISISLLTGGSIFFKFLLDKGILGSNLAYYLLEAAKYIILTAMFFFTISFIYYLAPAKDSKFRFISAGSSLATFLALAASIGFNFYVSNFSSYNALYGSIGTLLIILVWIYFNSIILLIGFELNASIQQAGKTNNSGLKPKIL
ncbi:MAG: YihY/virulence factor BrkB family protein [Bacteroidales bacterium]|nr:YihY/virulence factor BrkB family protein [Bacteroidales bacterium]